MATQRPGKATTRASPYESSSSTPVTVVEPSAAGAEAKKPEEQPKKDDVQGAMLQPSVVNTSWVRQQCRRPFLFVAALR